MVFVVRWMSKYDSDYQLGIGSDIDEFADFQNKSGFEMYVEKMKLQVYGKDLQFDILLPAHLYNGKESCGKKKVIGCMEVQDHENSSGFIKGGKDAILSCNNKGCKTCFVSAIVREAQKMTERMVTFTNLKNNSHVYLRGNRKRVMKHVVVSVPRHLVSYYSTNEGRKKLRKKTLDLLMNEVYEKIGKKKILIGKNDIDGGVMIDHPYRFKNEFNDAYLSPHFHFILTGWLESDVIAEINRITKPSRNSEGSEFYPKGEDPQGFLIKGISNVNTRDDCFRLSAYLLSHAALFSKKWDKRSSEHSIRYFGECHNRKFKTDSVLKYSKTGQDDMIRAVVGTTMRKVKLANGSYDRKEFDRSRLERIVKGKREYYHHVHTSYTHSKIVGDIKESVNINYESNESVQKLAERLTLEHVKPKIKHEHKENPVYPQSVPKPKWGSMEYFENRFNEKSSIDLIDSSRPIDEKESDMEFLQFRFDYSRVDPHIDAYQEDSLIVQSEQISEYLTVILDPRIDNNCPCCSRKMRSLSPVSHNLTDDQKNLIKTIVSSLDENGEVMEIADPLNLFCYSRYAESSPEGMAYFDELGNICYDPGVYHAPDCFDSMPKSIRQNITENIVSQRVRFEVYQNTGLKAERHEIESRINLELPIRVK